MKEWKKIDLHIHTRVGKNYNNGNESENTGKYYSLENLLLRNRLNNFDLIAITNHNSIDVIELIKAAYVSKYSNTNLLPGAELDVYIVSDKRYHIIVIFSESTNILEISNRLENIISKNGNNFLYIEDLFELISGTECIIIPHACKNPHGLKETQIDEVNLTDAEDIMNIITSSSSLNVLFEHTQAHFKESFKDSVINQALNKWLSEDEILELKQRIETEYTASDYRFSSPKIVKEKRQLPKIWASPTFRGLQLACMFHKNRIRMEGNIFNKTNYIEKIVIEDSKNFYFSEIQLSSGLNSIIGESASGKTALLDIITTRLEGENAVQGKNYSNLCSDLKVSFYNQNGFPLKLNDIKIHIAKNLYDSIKSAHDKEDNRALLQLFNFSEIRDSNTLILYEKKIIEASKNYRNKVECDNLIRTNLDNIAERSKILLINNDNKMNNLVIDIPLLDIKNKLSYMQNLFNDIKKYKDTLNLLKDNYNNIKYKLEEIGIKNNLIKYQQELEKEIIKIERTIINKGILLSYRSKVVDKLTNIINNLNNTINQKNAYISSTKLKLYDELEKLKINLRERYISNFKYISLDLTFPSNEIKNEMSSNNSHQYVEIEYNDFDEILEVEETTEKSTGILSVKNSLKAVEKFRNKVVKKDEDIKGMIESLIQNDKNILVKTTDLLQNIIKKAKIKIGFPNEEKIDINELTPGLTAKLYIDYLFNVEIEDGVNNVVVFDQPENDVDKEFIYNELIPKFDRTKFNLQIIITSHEPLLVINGDTNQIIKAEKKKKKIKYISYKLDEYLDKNTVTSIIAKYIDGSVTAVKNRYEIYIGGKK